MPSIRTSRHKSREQDRISAFYTHNPLGSLNSRDNDHEPEGVQIANRVVDAIVLSPTNNNAASQEEAVVG